MEKEIVIRLINEKANRRYSPLLVLAMVLMGYSIYAQATKIEALTKEIKELKKGK